MKWTRFTINTITEAVDVLSYELDAIGVEGIEIEDHLPLSEEDKQKMFVDILPDPEVVDNIAKVHFYLEKKDAGAKSSAESAGLSADDPESVICKVQEVLAEMRTYMDVGEGTVTLSETEDKDWINNWKEYFKPFRASKHIAITPTWIDEADMDESILGAMPEDSDSDRGSEDVEILKIDPGIAFGTGSHETTKLCIQALDKHLRTGDRVLDIGCGSGILSIAALLLGAGYATAIDIDEIAVKVAKENFDVNSIDTSTYELIAGNLLGDESFVDDVEKKSKSSSKADDPDAGYDIVVANILPDVIVPLTPLVPRFIKKGGIYITSGILAARAPEVKKALEAAGFTNIVETPMGEWVSLLSVF